MAVQIKAVIKPLDEEKSSKRDDVDSPTITSNLNAPKHGTVIPNRVFVGGISSATTEQELTNLFSKYGNVVGTKIIVDRAGVSKGYGFVTFETDVEARKSQTDAENIMLGARRLNIAPAIKKQGFPRGGYEFTNPPPMTSHPPPVHRTNGIAGITFQNGMAYFTPAQPQSMHQQPTMEPNAYQQGAYGTLAPSSGGPGYTFSFPQQGGVFYSAIPPYPYPIPVEPCYDGQLVIGDGNMIFSSPYYIANTPAPEMSYYQPPPNYGHEPVHSYQPYIYTPRGYESPSVYTPDSKCGMENGLANNGGEIAAAEETNRPVASSAAVVLNGLPDNRHRETAATVVLLRDCQPPPQFIHPHHKSIEHPSSTKPAEMNNVSPTFRRPIQKRIKYPRNTSRHPATRIQVRLNPEQQPYQPKPIIEQRQSRISPQQQRPPRLPPNEQQSQPGSAIEEQDKPWSTVVEQVKPTPQSKQQGTLRPAMHDQGNTRVSEQQETSEQPGVKPLPNESQQIENNPRDLPPGQIRNQSTAHQSQQPGQLRDRQHRQRNVDSRRIPHPVGNSSHLNQHSHYPFTQRPTLAPPPQPNYFPPPFPPASSARSRSFHPRHNGNSRGRGKWVPHRGEDTAAQLTPPDTPRANGAPTVSASSSNSDVVQSMQALAI